jgi:hypothetical protein
MQERPADIHNIIEKIKHRILFQNLYMNIKENRLNVYYYKSLKVMR